MRHFVVYNEGKDDPIDCFATEQAAQKEASAFFDRMHGMLYSHVKKAMDGTICPACGMQVDDGLEAEEV